MKKCFLLLTIFILSSFNSYSQVSADGNLLFLPFNNSVKDESGKNLKTEPNRTNFTSDRFGNEKAAYEMKKKSDYVKLNPINSKNISISLWYYFNGTDGNEFNVLLGTNDDKNNPLVISKSSQIGFFYDKFISSGYIVEERTWRHYVLVKTDKNSRLFINGVLIQEIVNAQSNETFPLTYLGNSSDEGFGALGTLDDIRIYDRALSENEIFNLFIETGDPNIISTEKYNSENVSLKRGVIAHYSFSSITENQFLDESGGANIAKVSGVVLTKDRFGNPNSACQFESKNSYMDVKDIATPTLSVSFWYYFGGVGSGDWNTLLCKEGVDYHHLLISKNGIIGYYNNKFYPSKYTLPRDEWKHIVLIKEGIRSRLYIDKVKIQEENSSFANNIHPLSVIGNIGKDPRDQGSLGCFDDIRIYNRALGDNDIEALFEEGKQKNAIVNQDNKEDEFRLPKIWAVVIGTSKYEKSDISLKYADADAKIFYDFLKSPNGGSLEDENVALLLNEKTTRANIIKEIQEKFSRALDDDLVILYIAGHGIPDRGEIFFLSYDADPKNISGTAVAQRDIDKEFKFTKARKKLWIADACHSGGATDGTRGLSEARMKNKYLLELASSEGGFAMIAASRGDEFSKEDKKWGGGHGVFTYFLVEGLKGEADSDKDGVVRMMELYDYVYKKVGKETNEEQHPAINGGADKKFPLSVLRDK